MTRTDSAGRRLTRIGIFYDGSYFTNINNYYTYAHPRRSRLNLGGLHDLRKAAGGRRGGGAPRVLPGRGHALVPGPAAHGRSLGSAEESPSGCGTRPCVSYGIVTHYLPVPVIAGQPVRKRGIDVWFALEALELALLGRFDVVVLVTGDRDYVPLVRKLNALGVRVMLQVKEDHLRDEPRGDAGDPGCHRACA